MEEKTGYIYILTNKSFKENWIKIGYADDVQRRVNELSNTSLPFPFEIYAYYEIPKISGSMPDKKLHEVIQTLNPDLRLAQNREFFEIAPWDAYNILESMAIIHNRLDKLHRNKDNEYGSEANNEEINEEYTVELHFPHNSSIRPLYEKIKKAIFEIGNDIIIKPNKNYVAFRFDNGRKKGNNICTLRPHPNYIEIALNLKLNDLNDPENVAFDISNRMWTNSQYAIKFDESDDINYVKGLIVQSYKKNKI